MEKYSYQYIVLEKDIDELNHVNNVVYVQWMQDAATKHWNALTKGKKFDKYVWVVKRHEIDYVRSAVLGDELTIHTWVGKTEGYTSVRHVEVQRNGKTIIKAQTVWALLDENTFRPRAIGDDVMALLNI